MAGSPIQKSVERVKSMARSESSSSSSRSSTFSTTTKEILKSLNTRCWACSNIGRNLQCAHVVPIGDMETEYLQSLALLPFPIAGYENGMTLCANCHILFDDMLNPGWIFVPADLDYFIKYELEDQKVRLQGQSIRDRAVPDSREYLAHQVRNGAQLANATMPTYTRYTLGPENWGSVTVTGDKEWHGHPLAAIRMALRVLGAVRNDAVPIEVREKLSYLLDLYRSPLDKGQHQPAAAPPSSPNRDGDGGDGDEDGDGNGDIKRKRKGKELPEAGPSQSKRRSLPAVKKTQAAERPKRQGAGKRKHRVLLNAPIQPLYDSDDEIVKWIQAVEPYHVPPTPESVKALKKDVKLGKRAHHLR